LVEPSKRPDAIYGACIHGFAAFLVVVPRAVLRAKEKAIDVTN
jgi:hypothetical protein